MEQPRTILMVDDEPFILSATAQFLRSSGYEVHTCDQWMGVATIVRNSNPDLILMDYNMPGIKGDEMCRILKRNAPKDGLRIVIFSSEPESDLITIVGHCGADGFIPKNTPGHLLLQTLTEHLECAAVA
jgi:CheY-like chemotaxis protein